MLSQNNPSWKLNPINESKNTIGEVGCLLTSLCNAYNIKYPNTPITPLHLNTALIDNNGYTIENYIIWGVAEKVINAKIEHIYTGTVEYDMNAFYIANFLNFGSGHFTNVISKDDNKYNIFDVYDGEYKKIPTPRRLVKVVFE